MGREGPLNNDRATENLRRGVHWENGGAGAKKRRILVLRTRDQVSVKKITEWRVGGSIVWRNDLSKDLRAETEVSQVADRSKKAGNMEKRSAPKGR